MNQLPADKSFMISIQVLLRDIERALENSPEGAERDRFASMLADLIDVYQEYWSK